MEPSPLRALLIVDADARFRMGVAFAFRRAGYSVRATGEAREVVELARGCQVVVSGPSLGRRALGALVEALRRTQRAVPAVLAVGPAELHDEALAAGAVEHLGQPAYLHDLVTLARLAAATTDATGVVTGAIEDYGVYLLARACVAARRSTRVLLQRPSSTGDRLGELHIAGGRLAAARAGRQGGASAFLQLLLWDAGGLRVVPAEDDPEHEGGAAPLGPEADAIAKPTERLLDDGLRFLSQFQLAAARVGGRHAVYRRDERRLAEVRRQIPAQVLSFLGSYDGERSVLELVEDAPFRPLDTLMITFRLVELEVIAPRTDPAHEVARTLRAKQAVRAWLPDAIPTSRPISRPGARPVTGPAARSAVEAPSSTSRLKPVPIAKPAPIAPAPTTEPATDGAPILLLRECSRPEPAPRTPMPVATERPASVAPPAAAAAPIPTPISSEPTQPLAIPVAQPAPSPAASSPQTSPRSRRDLERHSRETVRLPLISFDALDEEFFAGEAALGDDGSFEEQDDPSDEVQRWFRRSRPR